MDLRIVSYYQDWSRAEIVSVLCILVHLHLRFVILLPLGWKKWLVS